MQEPTVSIEGAQSPTQVGYPIEFEATLRSVETRVNDVGKGDAQTYGLSVLEGPSEINDTYVKVRMLSTLDITDGSGNVGGFVELIWTDGTVLGLRQTGTASYNKADKESQIETQLEVVNGSGKATDTKGTGTLTGVRSSQLGPTMKIEVTLDLVNAPELITGDAGSRGTPTPSRPYSATIAP
jgi:hypothetical protein